MVYGYARVSTVGQASNGNSLEMQEKQLRAAGAEKVFVDRFTGTTMARPQYEFLQQQLRCGDTVIVTKIDRLGRSVSQASGVIKSLIDKGIIINVLNLGILSNDSVNTLMQNVLLSFAQFERDMIIQRTQEGKAIAKLDPDFHEGRPKKYTKKQMDHAMDLLKCHSYNQVAEMTGISRATLAREKKKRGITFNG